MRKWLILPMILLLLGGCASDVKKEKQSETEKETTNVTNVIKDEPAVKEETDEEAEIEEDNTDKSFETEWSDIENLPIPTKEEELIAQTGGLFTSEIPYTEETKQI